MAPLSTTPRRTSPHPLYRVEIEQAAFNHGFRHANGHADGWLFFRSSEGVPGEVAMANGLADDGAPWLLAVEHAGVAEEMRREFADHLAEPAPGTMRAAFAFAEQPAMRRALSRAWHLANSLPSFPLAQYAADTAHLGDTEADRQTRIRIGQDRFRRALDDYYNGRCPITGITQREMLRASHIVPWAECASDAERLDPHNGLLLAAHWDAAFDAGLISFDAQGRALFHPDLDPAARTLLLRDDPQPLRLTAAHHEHLRWHRERYGF